MSYPPLTQGVTGEFTSIPADANIHHRFIADDIINSVWYHDAIR
jgi:hypothetical protein